MKRHFRTALTVGTSKESLLYFDYIVPLWPALDALPDFMRHATRGVPLSSPPEVFSLVPPNLRSKEVSSRLSDIAFEGNETFIRFVDTWRDWLKERGYFDGVGGTRPRLSIAEFPEHRFTASDFDELLDRFIKDFDLTDVPVIARSTEVAEDLDIQSSDPSVTLSGVRLIDVSYVPWQHILEFRADQQSVTKLRRLRLFAVENYSGKSKSYVEDDLHQRIYDYDETARRAGFNTRLGAISTIFKSKTVAASVAGGSLFSVLFNTPAAVLAATVGGVCIELGNIALEVSRQRFELRNALRDNPVSYLMDAKKLADTLDHTDPTQSAPHKLS